MKWSGYNDMAVFYNEGVEISDQPFPNSDHRHGKTIRIKIMQYTARGKETPIMYFHNNLYNVLNFSDPLVAQSVSGMISISVRVLSNMSGVTVAITWWMRAPDVRRLGTHETFTWFVMHSHKKKSNGVISGERGDQKIDPVHTIQTSRQLSLRDLENYKLQRMKKGPDLLVDGARRGIHCLWGHKLFQHISERNVLYCNLCEERGPVISFFIKTHQTFIWRLSRISSR